MLQAQETKSARDWTAGMAAYDRVLATLKTVANNESNPPPKSKRRKVDRPILTIEKPSGYKLKDLHLCHRYEPSNMHSC